MFQLRIIKLIQQTRRDGSLSIGEAGTCNHKNEKRKEETESARHRKKYGQIRCPASSTSRANNVEGTCIHYVLLSILCSVHILYVSARLHRIGLFFVCFLITVTSFLFPQRPHFDEKAFEAASAALEKVQEKLEASFVNICMCPASIAFVLIMHDTHTVLYVYSR